jgi:hypothetical protein
MDEFNPTDFNRCFVVHIRAQYSAGQSNVQLRNYCCGVAVSPPGFMERVVMPHTAQCPVLGWPIPKEMQGVWKESVITNQ